MLDWNEADGLQQSMVIDALLSAFPNPMNFEMTLSLRLNKSYAELSGGGVTYRVGVFQVVSTARAEAWLDKLIDAARKVNPGNRQLRALRPVADLVAVEPRAGRQLEDIIRDDAGFQDVIPWVRKLDRLRGQICRIESPINQAVGTGWLVGNDLLLTNWHVVEQALSGQRQPSSYVCRFDYAADAAGTNPGTTVALANEWCLSNRPASPLELGDGDAEPTATQLDYALLRLAQPVGEAPGPTGEKRGWVATKRGVAAPATGAIMLVLQHPQGNPLKLALGAVDGVNAGGTRVLHDANTLGGSSGSPCLDATLSLVALHNAGDPLYDGVTGAPKHNQAVPLEPILASIEHDGAPRFWAP
jgi:hypothetical protein